MARTVILKGSGVRSEAPAAAAITPGHLLQLTGTGSVLPHGGAGQNAAPMFAVENDVVGQDIDTAYQTNENVIYEVLPKGAVVNALVAAGASAISAGGFVESAGDGTVRAHIPQTVNEGGTATVTIYSNNIVGMALESVDNSAGTSPARIKIQIV